MKNFIPYSKQCIGEEEKQIVQEVLDSNYLTGNGQIELYEKELSEYFGVKYAIAVSSGTAAQHIATLVLTNMEGRKVIITTPISFMSTANSILYTKNYINLVDINDYGNINPVELDTELSTYKKYNTNLAIGINGASYFTGIHPVDMAGLPCDIEDMWRLAKSHNLYILRDSSHSFGGEDFNGSLVGSCKYTDITIFSTHAIKGITSGGEGGVILTNNLDYDLMCRALRNHGRVSGRMKYLGYNYRLTEISAAIGRVQLKKLPEHIKCRREIAKYYDYMFKDIPSVRLPYRIKGKKHAFHLYQLRVDWNKFKFSRKEAMDLLKRNNIGTQIHYKPIYKEPYYQKRNSVESSDYPNANKFYKEVLSIPIFPCIEGSEIEYVAKKIKEIFNKYKKEEE